MPSTLCAAGQHMICTGCDCAVCHLTCVNGHEARVLYDGLCAECERARVRSIPFAGTACDKCSQTPAFRNPGTRRNEYLCQRCQVESGDRVILTPSDIVGVIAGCAGKDITDPAHHPYNIRGNKWQCTRCRRTLAKRASEVPASWKH